MEAIGLLETKGLVGMIGALDQMLKSAQVQLLKKEWTGGGLVTVILTGSVADVRTAIDVGTAFCNEKGCLAGAHVIPRCSDSVAVLINENTMHRPQPEESPICAEEESQPDISPRYSIEQLSAYTVKQLRQLLIELFGADCLKREKYITKSNLIQMILTGEREIL